MAARAAMLGLWRADGGAEGATGRGVRAEVRDERKGGSGPEAGGDGGEDGAPSVEAAAAREEAPVRRGLRGVVVAVARVPRFLEPPAPGVQRGASSAPDASGAAEAAAWSATGAKMGTSGRS